MTQMRVVPAIAWLPWGAAAFGRARDEEKSILLSIAAPWSAACREMDERCYCNAEIAAEVNRWFVPVRVDADRRPDVADRYDLGGLPTTAFLNADGDVLGGGTFVPPDRLIDALRQVRGARMTAARGASADSPNLRTGEQGQRPTSERGVTNRDQLIAQVFSSFDRTNAGFGTAPKFPLVAPVRLALDLFRESAAPEMAEYATRTLDAMAWSGLYDEAGGGFCRCATRADWTDPQPEKLLAINAALLDLYLEAGVTLRNERWLARAADALEFLQSTLAVGPGEGWRATTQSDDVRFSDANAAMASAALRASQVFEDASLREIALQALESVLLATYRPGRGIAHCAGGVRGLLTDHVAMAVAHVDAWDLTGDIVYQMMAQELVQFMLRTMSASDGGFADRSSAEADDAIGLLAKPVKPFVLNCEAAELLHRLSRVTGEQSLRQYAVQTLASVESRAGAHGPLAAHFLLAQRSLAR